MRNAILHNLKTDNPFRYGAVVDDPFFVNRVKELAEVKQSLESGQNLIIYSPRRYGKTSLIRKVLKDFQAKGYKTAFIDFCRIHSKEKFIEEYTKEIFRNYHSWEKAMGKAVSLAKNINPVVYLNERGLPEFNMNFDRRKVLQALAEVVNMPEKLADNKRWIVVFDEFQEIERLKRENFEKELRSSFQYHKNVSYVIMGNRKHLLTSIFTRKNRAVYNFGRLINLQKIPMEDFRTYLKTGFEESGTIIDSACIDRILLLADNIPFYVQMLASILWELTAGKHPAVTGAFIDETVKIALWHQTDYYMALMQELTGYQQKVLHAIAQENSGVFTREYAEEYYLSAGSSTQRALNKLIDRNILKKLGNAYYFVDPLFSVWLLSADD